MKAIDRLYKYLDYKQVKPTRFEKEIGFSNGYLGTQLKRKADLGESVINKIIDYCLDLDELWFITGKGSMLKNQPQEPTTPKLYTNKTSMDIVAEPTPKTAKILPLHPTKSAKRQELDQYMAHFDNNIDANLVTMPIIDIAGAAGAGYFNVEHPEQLGELKLPATMVRKRFGNYYCGRVHGESMIPTLQDGDYVALRLLNNNEWQDIKSNDIYFVVRRWGDSFIKRVVNDFVNTGNLICKSDNKGLGLKDLEVYCDDIACVYHVEWFFSNNLTNPTLLYEQRIDKIEDQLVCIQETIKNNLKTQS